MAVALAEMAERYPELPPVYITEGGASFEDVVVRDAAADRTIIPDERRLKYLADHIASALEATAPGGPAEAIDLRGYYVWSLLDNFEWSGGYKQQFGLLHVDRETLVRTPKASYYWLQEALAARNRAVPDDAGVPDTAADAERPHPVG
jgi:beta-glucosidase